MFFTGDSLCGVSGFFNFFEKDVRKSVYGRDRNGQRGAPYVRYISDGKPCSGVRGSQQASTDLSWAKFTHFFMGNVADTAVSQIQTQREYDIMKKTNVQKLVIAGILCAVAVAGSAVSFPVFGSKCAPVQHMVNIICAVLLGPGYGVAVALCSSLLRNLLGLGTLMAFPGSIFGALLCGITYWKCRKIFPTLLAEVFGTSVIGGLCAYPIAILFMGQSAADIAFYAYIIPFLVSTAGGAVLSAIPIYILSKTRVLPKIQRRVDR